MVIIMKPGTTQERIDALAHELEVKGLRVGITNGVGCSILGLVGDTTNLDADDLMLHEGVERVMRVQEPYKKANRKFHPEDTVVHCRARPGSAAATSPSSPAPARWRAEEQIVRGGEGRTGLRRGAAARRRLQAPHLPLLLPGHGHARSGPAAGGQERTRACPSSPRSWTPSMCELFEEKVDVVQVGARNMQNFELLKEVGKMSKPVLLKRGLANTYEEWIMSAEYIMAAGNENVILCERGIRTFETYTRNTLDVSAIPGHASR